MIDNARRIAAAVELPVIADADTGYGNAINVLRTVELYEQAGVAGIRLEDQVQPKRCGHLERQGGDRGRRMAGKIRAAVAARPDPDLVLIARTDAAAVEGLDAAMARARRYADAGADALFVEAPTSARTSSGWPRALRGGSAGVQLGRGRPHPPLPLARIAELGFGLVLFPIGTLLAATAGIRRLLAGLRADGTRSPRCPACRPSPGSPT